MIPPFIIAAFVGAIYWYLNGNKVAPTLPAALFAAPSTAAPTAPAPAATTSNPAGVTTTPGPVTNQPGTSGSGVPSSAPQNRPYANYNPGFTISPGLSTSRPFYGYSSGLFLPHQMRRMAAEATATSGGGCGCGGSCGGSCQGCGRANGRGSCIHSTATPATPPTTLNNGYIANLATVPEANQFMHVQSLLDQADTDSNGVPAGPTWLR
jgi:hypothetical protein